MSDAATYPVRVDATLDSHLNRWLWLVKWLLAIPHYVVLLFLWVAFVVVSVVGFFAILVTGRYPPTLFEFNVGVLRWSWRVAYYSYGALGTDRYPPFTLAEVADYPAHLQVDYPGHLSRGLVLIKWWLLAVPQYLVVAIFAGGGIWAAWQNDHNAAALGPGGLIGLLVLVAAIALAVTGRYPQQIFDFVLGLNRWVLRVAGYAALMTDHYPPFRLDMGGHETEGTTTAPSTGGTPVAPPADDSFPPVAGPPRPASGWTALRAVSLVAGSLLALLSVGLLAAGGAATWLDNTQRDTAGYLTSNTHSFATSSYAITSDRIDLGTSDVVAPSAIVGSVRIRATASVPAKSVFVGIAPLAPGNTYLAGVGRALVTNWATGTANYHQSAGQPPPSPPTRTSIWVASASGTGPRPSPGNPPVVTGS